MITNMITISITTSLKSVICVIYRNQINYNKANNLSGFLSLIGDDAEKTQSVVCFPFFLAKKDTFLS